MDTSVWITLLNRRAGALPSPDEVLRFVTCGPIIQEVLQGVREDSMSGAFRDGFLAIPRLSDPIPLAAFLEAADIYRQGRRKGYSIRSSTDCLIAAIAIQNDVPVWHRDRDFSFIARFTSLRAFDRPAPATSL